jgi:diacylglycerol kinase (ATP)
VTDLANAPAPDVVAAPPQRKLHRALAIFNPRSGNQSGERIAGWLTELAQSNNVELVLRETSAEVDAKDLVQDADQFDRVIGSGGDGTIMQVMNGIANKGIPFSVIPSGTGNALAQALQLTLDLRRATEEVFQPAVFSPLDLGLLNDRLYFALRLSVGYEAVVTQDTTRELKTRFGKMAYVMQALRHAVKVRSVSYRFIVDGKMIRRRAESVWVANAGSLGALDLDLDRSISYNDGRLDLCVMRLSLKQDLRTIAQRLIMRQRLPASAFSRIPVRQSIRIITYPRQPVQVDGEMAGETPCEIKVVPNAIQICRPAPAAA